MLSVPTKIRKQRYSVSFNVRCIVLSTIFTRVVGTIRERLYVSRSFAWCKYCLVDSFTHSVDVTVATEGAKQGLKCYIVLLPIAVRFKGGLRHGQGVQLVKGVYEYTGQWKDDVRSGQGKCRYADGSCYDGEWHGDDWHGAGLLVATDGSKYQGEWLQGKQHGTGEGRRGAIGVAAGEIAWDSSGEGGESRRKGSEG